MKYTKKDLDYISELYETNFSRMLETTGTADHEKYVRIERILTDIDYKIRRQLMLLV